jgi:hypothetical protein
MTVMAEKTAPWTRDSKLRLGAGGAAASCAACCTNSSDIFGATFSPVNSRKLPQEPQNVSASPLWNPHLRQTIMG